MRAFVPVGRVPVRRAVLVPCHRGSEPRFLHEGHFVVGHEIVAQESRCHAQQPGMAVEPERGIHEMQIAVEQFDGPRRTAVAQRRLLHRHRMAAVVLVRAAQLIAQRPRQPVGWLYDAVAENRTSVAVDGRAGFYRRARQNAVDVGAQLGQFLGPDHAFEDVEAVRPVGLDDRAVEAALLVEPDWSAVAQLHCPGNPGAAVVGHRPRMLCTGQRCGVWGRCGLGHRHRKISRTRQARDDNRPPVTGQTPLPALRMPPFSGSVSSQSNSAWFTASTVLDMPWPPSANSSASR